MSPELDKPVHKQLAVATSKGPLNGEYHGSKKLERTSFGKRRVFVQTETGYVLGIELDRSDNAHTVKRKLRLAFDVPTDESLLVCGDMVLKNDLSIVRNDSPLLLTRNLHRSSSTPCLSPTGKDLQQKDHSGPIEVLGYSDQFSRTKQLVVDIVKAIRNGIDPVPVHSGLGGAYYFRNCNGENIAIVKPTDEEPYAPNNPKGFVGKALGQPGLKRSVRVGETGFREVAAFLLDYNNFANVPNTALVKITHSVFNVNDKVKGNMHQKEKQASKIASLQQFISHDFDASDHGTSSFPVGAVHRIGILDIRILNTDRHAGNLLIRKLDRAGRFGQVELVPIDHGLCLPETLEDPYFEWIHWPQASIPFLDDELAYINELDPFKDSDMLRRELPMIREACLRVLVLCTIFLKEAASFGLCLSQIGEMMSREFRGHEEQPSELEILCTNAKKLLKEHVSDLEPKATKEEFQFELENGEEELDSTPTKGEKIEIEKTSRFRPKGGNGRYLLSKLIETAEENMEGLDAGEFPQSSDECSILVQERTPTVSKLSASMKNTSIGEKSWRHHASMQNGYLVGTSSGNRCINEQLIMSCSFVKLADMNDEEWVQFLENFQKLLRLTFSNRKGENASQRQRQRLGTSCQF